MERVLFALVANRALAPSSKLAATSLGRPRRAPARPGRTVSDDACYRAMDWLIAVEDRLARGVFDAVAHLLNLEVDLIFFDTTSTYFETEEADEPVWRDEHGRVVEPDAGARAPAATGRRRSRRRARRRRRGSAATASPRTPATTCPQVVVGMAVTRDGIPVRVWCWPGNTSDSPLIRQVKDELRDWTLGKVIWVADRGFTSAANRRHLAAGGGRLHPGREAALRLRRGRRGAGPPRPLPGREREPARQGSQDHRARAVRGLPQPRRRRPRRRRPREPGRTAGSDDRRLGPVVADASGPSCAG